MAAAAVLNAIGFSCVIERKNIVLKRANPMSKRIRLILPYLWFLKKLTT
jgi:hypothetical protein